jgi:hypothetical protein
LRCEFLEFFINTLLLHAAFALNER